MWALPEVHAERAAVLDRACEAAGRDPGDVRRSTQALVVLTDDEAAATRFVEAVAPRAAFAGTAERFAELVGAWAEVGVDEVIVPDFAMGSADRTRDALDAIIEVLRPVR
jgi:alkanesulfonate monooxygenase SsuD/methylene tetrahydromethanopterin reductase-like flavin-dependent oxidoreductase (luciferase family)